MSGLFFKLGRMKDNLLRQISPDNEDVESAQIARMASQARRDGVASIVFALIVTFALLSPIVDEPVSDPQALLIWLGAMILYAPILYSLSHFVKQLERQQKPSVKKWRRICYVVYTGNAILWGFLNFAISGPESQLAETFIMLVYFGLTTVYAVHASSHFKTYALLIVSLYSMIIICAMLSPSSLTGALTLVLPFFVIFILILGYDNNAAIRGSIERELKQKKLLQDLELARQRAVESNHAKSNFLAMMSHELRTPLNAIIGFADIMKTGTFGEVKPDRYAGYVGDIHDSGKHLLALLDELLELSSIDAGSTKLKEEMVDIKVMIHSIISWVQERANKRSIKLLTDIQSDLPDVYADPVRLKQILLNLITNAVKYTKPGGQAFLRCEVAENGQLIFEVSDTGIGIASENLESIFEPFTRLTTSSYSAHDGVGLGLAITKRLVDLHSGEIKIQSELGIGTKANVILPADRVITSLHAREAFEVQNIASGADTAGDLVSRALNVKKAV